MKQRAEYETTGTGWATVDHAAIGGVYAGCKNGPSMAGSLLGEPWSVLASSNDQYRRLLWWVFVVLHIATWFIALMVALCIYKFIDHRFRPSTRVTNLFYGCSGLAAIYFGYYANGPICITLYGIVCVLGSIQERKGD
jgi:hypothetical protein